MGRRREEVISGKNEGRGGLERGVPAHPPLSSICRLIFWDFEENFGFKFWERRGVGGG